MLAARRPAGGRGGLVKRSDAVSAAGSGSVRRRWRPTPRARAWWPRPAAGGSRRRAKGRVTLVAGAAVRDGGAGAGATRSRRSRATAPRAVAWTRRARRAEPRRSGGRASARRRAGGWRAAGAEPRWRPGRAARIAVTWLDRHRDFARAMGGVRERGRVRRAGRARRRRRWSVRSSSPTTPAATSRSPGRAQALAGSGPSVDGEGSPPQPGGRRSARVQEPGSGLRLRRAAGRGRRRCDGRRRGSAASGAESGALGHGSRDRAARAARSTGRSRPSWAIRRTLGARVTTVGDALLLVYTMRRGPLRATVRQADGAGSAPPRCSRRAAPQSRRWPRSATGAIVGLVPAAAADGAASRPATGASLAPPRGRPR